MNYREAAALLGVSEATVSRLASGTRKPSINLMVAIHERLGWNIESQARLVTGRTRMPYHRVFKRLVDLTPVGFVPIRPGFCPIHIALLNTDTVE